MSLLRPLLSSMGVLALALPFVSATAQNVSPIIAEYTAKAAGSFEVTNSSLAPAVVVLEPKSFKIREDGEGEFRDLDASIHLELSATSLRLEPRQSARIFYKVAPDRLPAWLCIYATFSPVKKKEGINVRMMLPHTVYVYQRLPLATADMTVGRIRYDAELHHVLCEITNDSEGAGRALSVEVTGKHGSVSAGGFPMLPHEDRVITIDWHEQGAPDKIDIQFEHFSIKRPITEMVLDVAQQSRK